MNLEQKIELIENAISNNQILFFEYHGHERYVEPHVLGSLNGVWAILGYQQDGDSESSAELGWRRFNVGKMHYLTNTGMTFKVRRSSWDEVLSVVR